MKRRDISKGNGKTKKIILNTLSTIIWIIVISALALTAFTAVVVNVMGENQRSIFGIMPLVVTSGSMSKTDFKEGDLILVNRNFDKNELKEGDIISFLSEDIDSWGEVVTHKIRRIETDSHGNRVFFTYGTTTNADDRMPAGDIIGKYVGRLPKMGYLVENVKSENGYYIFVLAPFLVIFLFQGISLAKLYRQMKRERQEQGQQLHLGQIEDENNELRRRLEELSSQLDENSSNSGDSDEPR